MEGETGTGGIGFWRLKDFPGVTPVTRQKRQREQDRDATDRLHGKRSKAYKILAAGHGPNPFVQPGKPESRIPGDDCAVSCYKLTDVRCHRRADKYQHDERCD